MPSLLLAYYGDDFTGSTDSMEALESHGVATVLFFEPPTVEQLARFPGVRAVGVAGVSRTLSPAQMDAELVPAFEAMRTLGAPIIHYKVCSTFDSSPSIGSIGRAIDIGARAFDAAQVPVVVGAPRLNRFVAFGNLFARMNGVTYRLDRHPTMSRHPITPMTESDLRLHLRPQTDKRVGLVDMLALDAGEDAVNAAYDAEVKAGTTVILFDTLTADHMRQIGRKLWALRQVRPLFVVGSSGVEYALAAHWQASGEIAASDPNPPPGAVEQLLVVTGSASPVTSDQIDYALEYGYKGIRVDASRLIDTETADDERARLRETALRLLADGESVVLYSARGPEDPAIARTRTHMDRLRLDPQTIGCRLGTQQGRLLREILDASDLRRVCVAGGDTCGYAAKQLGIVALQVQAPLVPGAPLCRASADEARVDGLEIVLKSGQFGGADFFVRVQHGGDPPEPARGSVL